MKLFRSLTTLLVPKKAEFTKRLIAKRQALRENALLPISDAQLQMRRVGLEAAEFAVSPEATIVNILEQYWDPAIRSFYSETDPFSIYKPPLNAFHYTQV